MEGKHSNEDEPKGSEDKSGTLLADQRIGLSTASRVQCLLRCAHLTPTGSTEGHLTEHWCVSDTMTAIGQWLHEMHTTLTLLLTAPTQKSLTPLAFSTLNHCWTPSTSETQNMVPSHPLGMPRKELAVSSCPNLRDHSASPAFHGESTFSSLQQ